MLMQILFRTKEDAKYEETKEKEMERQGVLLNELTSLKEFS